MSELLAIVLDTEQSQQQAADAHLGAFVAAFAQALSERAHCQRAASRLIAVLAGSRSLRAAAAASASAKAVFAQATAFSDDPETLAVREMIKIPESKHPALRPPEALVTVVAFVRGTCSPARPQACFSALHAMVQSGSHETRDSVLGRFGPAAILSTAAASARRHSSEAQATREALRVCRAVLLSVPEATSTAVEIGAPPDSSAKPETQILFCRRTAFRADRPLRNLHRLASSAGLQQLCRTLLDRFDVVGKTPAQERMVSVAHEARAGADTAARPLG